MPTMDEAVSGAGVDDFDLVVIGSGPAGEKGATQAAYYGHRVAVVERRADPGRVGDRCVRGAGEGPAGRGDLPHRMVTS